MFERKLQFSEEENAWKVKLLQNLIDTKICELNDDYYDGNHECFIDNDTNDYISTSYGANCNAWFLVIILK